MDLYSALLTTAPFILLAISRGVAFGPIPAAARHRAAGRSRWWLTNDLLAVAFVMFGAVVSLLVLGDVVEATSNTALFAVVTCGASLFLLTVHVLGEIVPRYASSEPPESA